MLYEYRNYTWSLFYNLWYTVHVESASFYSKDFHAKYSPLQKFVLINAIQLARKSCGPQIYTFNALTVKDLGFIVHTARIHGRSKNSAYPLPSFNVGVCCLKKMIR